MSGYPGAAPAAAPSRNSIFCPYMTKAFYDGGKCRAVFIGVCYRGTRLELDGPGRDIQIMLRTLEKIGFPLDECVVLTDDPTVFPEHALPPTKENIIFWLRWLVAGAEPGDVFFLHVSGHAIRKKQAIPDGTEKDDCDSALVPIDHRVGDKDGENVILDDQLFDILCNGLCSGTRLTAFFDTCTSSGLLDLPFELLASSSLVRDDAKSYAETIFAREGSSAPLFRRVNNNTCRGAVICFSGCEDGQSSADATHIVFKTSNRGGQAAGAATCALAETLLATAGLTYGEILFNMRRELKGKRGLNQVPQLSCSAPIDLTKPFSLFGQPCVVAEIASPTRARPAAAAAPAIGSAVYPTIGDATWAPAPFVMQQQQQQQAPTAVNRGAGIGSVVQLPTVAYQSLLSNTFQPPASYYPAGYPQPPPPAPGGGYPGFPPPPQQQRQQQQYF